jgi:magnesium chelatase family protein
MSFAKLFSAQTSLLSAHIVSIEVDLSQGLHAFSIVGLPDKAVEEARDRVSAAIKNSGFTSPKSKNQKVVISLAPAELKKEGSAFDVGIALGYLLAAGDVSFSPDHKLFMGELSLDGTIRGISGVLPLVAKARDEGFEEVYVPAANAKEAALIDGIAVYPIETLSELLEHLTVPESTEASPSKPGCLISVQPKTEITRSRVTHHVDFSDVRGQEAAKRGLEIAAAGGHNVAMFGPAGTGKTMLARAFVGILPELDFDEILEVTGIYSIAGTLNGELMTHPPFRAPHHSASYVAMIGGGTTPRPGEVTLAHRGVLFLDEFPEFDRRVIEVLRQPLEESVVAISRARGSAIFPADFILVAAMNPCPCGNFGTEKVCKCQRGDLLRYNRKLSGPIADRIDLWIEVGQIEHEKLAQKAEKGESSEQIRTRVEEARGREKSRFQAAGTPIKMNSAMSVEHLSTLARLDDDTELILREAAKKLELSARSYHRTIKLARTIADLAGEEHTATAHILEALQYRPKRLQNPL